MVFADVGTMWAVSVKFRLIDNHLKVPRGDFN